jgi:hypothetical protein
VEPSSVTPFSVPARDRALHASLVVLARHARGWSGDDAAAEFEAADATWRRILDDYLGRVDAADSDELPDVQRHIAVLEGAWADRALQAEPTGGLRYAGGGRERLALLRRFGTAGEAWATLDSMRSVDVDVRLRVRGED